MNFRQLIRVGKNVDRVEGFSSEIYLIGCRGRTVHYAHGAVEVKRRLPYPLWLQHGRWQKTSEGNALGTAYNKIAQLLGLGFTALPSKHKAWFRFDRGTFFYKTLDGRTKRSVRKRFGRKR